MEVGVSSAQILSVGSSLEQETFSDGLSHCYGWPPTMVGSRPKLGPSRGLTHATVYPPLSRSHASLTAWLPIVWLFLMAWRTPMVGQPLVETHAMVWPISAYARVRH